jgi:hypothetical protein
LSVGAKAILTGLGKAVGQNFSIIKFNIFFIKVIGNFNFQILVTRICFPTLGAVKSLRNLTSTNRVGFRIGACGFAGLE